MSNQITAPITVIRNVIDAPINTSARDAYQLAVAGGFVGTRAEWLASLNSADLVSATPPTSPVEGMRWFSSVTGLSYTYFDGVWVSNSAGPAYVAHADKHAAGGEDPITPASIGAEVAGAAATAQAAAIQRANHTGTQATSTITGLDDALAARVLIADIRDNLTSAEANKPLSAAQGKILKDAIDAINTLLGSDETTLDTLQEIVDFIQLNRSDLDALSIASIAGLQTALDAKETPAGAQAKADAAQAAAIAASPAETATTVAAIIDGAAEVTTPADANKLPMLVAGVLKWVSWANAWTNIFKGKADALYVALTGNQNVDGVKTFNGQVKAPNQTATEDADLMTRILGDMRFGPFSPWVHTDTAGGIDGTANGGSCGLTASGLSLNVTATANSRAKRGINLASRLFEHNAGLNFSRRIIISFRLFNSTLSGLQTGATGYIEVGRAAGDVTMGPMSGSNKGFGVSLSGSTVSPFVYDGTTFTTTLSSGSTFSWKTYPRIIFDFRPGVAFDVYGMGPTGTTPTLLASITTGLPTGSSALYAAMDSLNFLLYTTSGASVADLGVSSISMAAY